MFEENGAREINSGKPVPLAGIIGAGVLLLVSLGALVYFFLIPVP